MLGQELAKTFQGNELFLWDKEELNITDAERVKKGIKELRPELIINSAAYNAVDDCEENFELAKKINCDGPINLAKAASMVGAFFVHYSTDYVFNGERKEGYVEYDLPAPISKYGESKYLGEEVFEHNDATYLIRTSRLFGKQASAPGAKKSFAETMLKLADEKEEIEVVDEEISNPTYVVDLAHQTKLIVEGNYAPGIYHATNEGGCTWYEFALEIFKLAGKTVRVKPVFGEKFPRPAKRPKFSSLRNTKLPKMRSWQAALGEFISELNPSTPLRASILNKVTLNQVIQTASASVVNNHKIMKGIVLSGGKGTRLQPLTKITSKQLLPVFHKPMIMFPLETLMKAGIKDILVIVSPDYAGQYLHLLGSGKEMGIKLTYEIQDEPRGLPEAFIIGENFIGEDNVTMILGDNIFFDHDFTQDIQSFEKGGRVFAVEVPDPERFGVVEFDQNNRVLSIEEKPTKPKSNYAIPGMYIYDQRVCNIAKVIKPTWRPETDITEIHKAYLDLNELDVRKVHGRWLDAGTHESLLKASNWIAAMEYQKKMGYNGTDVQI